MAGAGAGSGAGEAAAGTANRSWLAAGSGAVSVDSAAAGFSPSHTHISAVHTPAPHMSRHHESTDLGLLLTHVDASLGLRYFSSSSLAFLSAAVGNGLGSGLPSARAFCSFSKYGFAYIEGVNVLDIWGFSCSGGSSPSPIHSTTLGSTPLVMPWLPVGGDEAWREKPTLRLGAASVLAAPGQLHAGAHHCAVGSPAQFSSHHSSVALATMLLHTVSPSVSPSCSPSGSPSCSSACSPSCSPSCSLSCLPGYGRQSPGVSEQGGSGDVDGSGEAATGLESATFCACAFSSCFSSHLHMLAGHLPPLDGPPRTSPAVSQVQQLVWHQ